MESAALCGSGGGGNSPVTSVPDSPSNQERDATCASIEEVRINHANQDIAPNVFNYASNKVQIDQCQDFDHFRCAGKGDLWVKLERKYVAALALIGVALVLFAYRYGMKDEFDLYFGVGKQDMESSTPKMEQVGEESETQGENAKHSLSRTPGSSAVNGLKPPAVVESIRRARAARSASEAMDVVADMRRAGFETAADDLEYQVNVFCVGHGELEPVFENTRWATEIVNEYCSSYDNSISLLEFNDMTPPWAAGIEVLYNSFMLSTDKKKAEKVLVKLIIKAEAPEELDAFQGVLGRFRDSDQYVFDLGQGDDLGYIDPVELQVTALELFRCDRFGGCGAGGIIIAERCHLMGIGEPGWDLETYLRQTMSPFEFARVQKIRHFLNHFQD